MFTKKIRTLLTYISSSLLQSECVGVARQQETQQRTEKNDKNHCLRRKQWQCISISTTPNAGINILTGKCQREFTIKLRHAWSPNCCKHLSCCQIFGAHT
jgi:hypothetical protein